MWPLKLDDIPKRDQVTWPIEYLGMHNTFVVVNFIMQYCSGKEYKGMALSLQVISLRVIPTIYTTSFLQLWFTFPNLTSTQATRISFGKMLSTEANCMQFLHDMKILGYLSIWWMVEGIWVLDGIQRGTNWCILTPCPGNLQDELSLLWLTSIQQFVLPGTTIITDSWKSCINLGLHDEYVHTDVNHSEDFVIASARNTTLILPPTTQK